MAPPDPISPPIHTKSLFIESSSSSSTSTSTSAISNITTIYQPLPTYGSIDVSTIHVIESEHVEKENYLYAPMIGWRGENGK